MRRFVILLCVFAVVILTGCSYREIDRGYLVTAIGFAGENGNINIYVEAISSPGILDSPPERVVLNAAGCGLQKAFDNLKKSLVKPLYFEQIGAVIVNNVSSKKTIDFLKSIPNINYGIFIVSTDNITALFDSQTPSGVLGYDIVGLVKTNAKIKNQLYQINRKNFLIPKVNFVKNILQLSVGEGEV